MPLICVLLVLKKLIKYEQCHEKTCLLSFQPDLTNEPGYIWPQKMARDLGMNRNCTIYVAKTKALISCTVTAQLICTFVFASNDLQKSCFLMTQLI